MSTPWNAGRRGTLFAPVNILSRAEAQEIAQRALRNSPAEETRVNINSSARADTRFALNQVTTSGENRDTTVTITRIVGNRSASVTTNRLDDASLAAAAKQAERHRQAGAAQSGVDAGAGGADISRRARAGDEHAHAGRACGGGQAGH